MRDKIDKSKIEVLYVVTDPMRHTEALIKSPKDPSIARAGISAGDSLLALGCIHHAISVAERFVCWFCNGNIIQFTLGTKRKQTETNGTGRDLPAFDPIETIVSV